MTWNNKAIKSVVESFFEGTRTLQLEELVSQYFIEVSKNGVMLLKKEKQFWK